MASLIGYYTASFTELVNVFGQPFGEDYDKVSTQWNITHNGSNYYLYDYKETNMYDEDLPSVQEFRNLTSYNWHIGGYGEPDEFITFLDEILNRGNQEPGVGEDSVGEEGEDESLLSEEDLTILKNIKNIQREYQEEEGGFESFKKELKKIIGNLTPDQKRSLLNGKNTNKFVRRRSI